MDTKLYYIFDNHFVNLLLLGRLLSVRKLNNINKFKEIFVQELFNTTSWLSNYYTIFTVPEMENNEFYSTNIPASG